MPNKNFSSVCLLVILALIIYAGSLDGAFLWDDFYLVEHNEYIKNWQQAGDIFTADIGKSAGANYGYWRPAAIYSYLIDYSLWKLDPFGYHLTNLLLHIFISIIFWRLCFFFFKDNFVSLLAAAVFTIHPVNVENVAYISSRADLLVSFFMLSCFFMYVKLIDSISLPQAARRTRVLGIALVILYLLALLSKENSLILPFLILVYHAAFKRKICIKAFIPVIACAAAYILLRLVILKSFIPFPGLPDFSFLQRIPGFFAAMTGYAKILVFPFGLRADYGNGFYALNDPRVIAGVIIFISLLIIALKKKDTIPVLFFGILWFFCGLLPVSGVYPRVYSYMAEHYLYFPMMGFCVALADRAGYFYLKKAFRFPLAAFIIFLCVFYSFLSVKQSSFWRNPVVFYRRILEFNPDSWRPRYSLGLAYYAAGKNGEAEESFKKTLILKKDYAPAYNNLGLIYRDSGNITLAGDMFEMALKFQPDFAPGHNNLAVVYCMENKCAMAFRHYALAVKYSRRQLPALEGLIKRCADNYGRDKQQ